MTTLADHEVTRHCHCCSEFNPFGVLECWRCSHYTDKNAEDCPDCRARRRNFRIVDASKLPEKFMLIDYAAIRAVAASDEEAPTVAGVEFYAEGPVPLNYLDRQMARKSVGMKLKSGTG